MFVFISLIILIQFLLLLGYWLKSKTASMSIRNRMQQQNAHACSSSMGSKTSESIRRGMSLLRLLELIYIMCLIREVLTRHTIC